jgi:hypothetical protein
MIFSFIFFFERSMPIPIKIPTGSIQDKEIPCTNDTIAEIGMNFAYIAINIRNFNRKADFRENATSLNMRIL